MEPISRANAWKRRAEFEYAMSTQRRNALRQLRMFEALDGSRLDAASKRLARDYAGDVLGSPRFAPWLYAYTKARGAFVEGWIPVDFFDLVVIRHVNGLLRHLSSRKTLFHRLFAGQPIPDVASIVGGVPHNLALEPLTPAALAELLADHDELVIKDDGGSGGAAVRVLATEDLDVGDLLRRHPDAVLQRRIRDHPQLRVFPDANGSRLRINTCKLPGGDVEPRACFIAIPKRGMQYTKFGQNVTLGVDVASGMLASRLPLASAEQQKLQEEVTARFEGVLLPGFARAVALVTRLHRTLPHLGVIGWDVMIDADANPWLVEFNTGHPGIGFQEPLVGPAFLGLGWHQLRWRPEIAL